MTTERMLDLLTEGTDRPLTRSEHDELERLLGSNAGYREDDFELAATAVHLAFLGRPDASMPSTLRAVILEQTSRDVAETGAMPRAPSIAEVVPIARAKGKPKPSLAAWSGWIAAAAAILIAILSIWLRPQPKDASALYAELAARPGVVRAAWAATSDPAAAGLRGEVVWDAESQRGVMRFEGLARNDPTLSQYQLWIFDARRDDAFPVDGGVFDGKEGVVLVPIDAKIRVFDPTAFAVTVERPGGVVVSKRERIVALAKVEKT
jgi:hypothetical protein